MTRLLPILWLVPVAAALLFAVSGCFRSRAGNRPDAPSVAGAPPAGSTPPSPVVFRPSPALLAAREQAASGGVEANPALALLRREAEKALRAGPFSVMDKQQVAPSGDKHDYLSLGRYWWPNPNTPDGLPYVVRDGKVNPEIDTIPDKQEMGKMLTSVSALAHGYAVFGDERYAEHAAQLLRTWFLDPATRMNPNLEYSQIHKGARHPVGGSGIIDGRDYGLLIEAAQLLQGSRAWTSQDDRGLRDWFARYLDWLMKSAGGRKEAATRNNHVTFFWYQALPIALYAGRAQLADDTLRTVLPDILDAQIEPDGSQPLELKRTKPFAYSQFNLMAWTRLANLAHSRGVNLWRHLGPGGRGSLQRAFEYLIPFATGEKPLIDDPPNPNRALDYARVLVPAAIALQQPQWETTARTLAGADASVLALDQILPPTTH